MLIASAETIGYTCGYLKKAPTPTRGQGRNSEKEDERVSLREKIEPNLEKRRELWKREKDLKVRSDF